MSLLHLLAARFGYRLIQAQQHNTIEEHLAELLPALGVGCVIDVGANTGQFGLKLRALGYRGRIASFEPVGEPFATLQERAAADPDWLAFPLALGAEPGRRTIHVTRSTQFASFRPPSAYGAEHFARFIPVERTEEVQVGTLDDEWPRVVARLSDPVVYLKLDTQGYDREVLEGARSSLARVTALQCELAVKHVYVGVPGYLDTLTALDRLGFEPTGFFPITREDGRLTLIEMDCVMRRKPAESG